VGGGGFKFGLKPPPYNISSLLQTNGV
jgi:hypothetical protein